MSALASQCAQHCYDERFFADSGEMCYGIVIQGLVLVLAQERQDNRLQHLIRIGLADQIPSITGRSVALIVLHILRDMANVSA